MKKILQNSIVNMNIKRLINAVETTMQRIKRKLMLKKMKVKVINDLIVNKKMLNAKAFKKDEDNA